MLTAILADDEEIVRSSMEKWIPWNELGVSLVGVASDGEEAYGMILSLHPDIVITDIRMPFMDGIELIKEVQKRGYNPICVIYSAYGEFEYAQNAISLGVREYLLKPIRLEAFKELFDKVIDLCRAKDEVVKEKEQIRQVKEEVTAYRLGWKLLSWLETAEKPGEEAEECAAEGEAIEKELGFGTMESLPVLISCYTNLFSAEWESYQREIEKLFGNNALIINKEDNQILVVCMRPKEMSNVREIKNSCDELLEQSKRKYHTDVFIVIGRAVDNLAGLKSLRYEGGMQKLVKGLSLDTAYSLLGSDLALINKVTCDLDGSLCSPLTISGLKEEQLALLDGELHILHITIVLLKLHGKLHELLVALRKILLKLCDGAGSTNACNDVLTLCIDEVLTIDALLTGGRITCKCNAGTGGIAHVSEYHGLYVYGCAPVSGDIVHTAINDGTRVVPGTEYGLNSLHELNHGILRELLALLLHVVSLEALDKLLHVICIELDIVLNALFFLYSVDDLLEGRLGNLHNYI